jgi:hypothetical protein
MNFTLTHRTALALTLCMPLACTIKTTGSDEPADDSSGAEDSNDDSEASKDAGHSDGPTHSTPTSSETNEPTSGPSESTADAGDHSADSGTSDETADAGSVTESESNTDTNVGSGDAGDAGDADSGDAAPPKPVVKDVDTIGVGVSGDLFCKDGSFTITVQPRDAEGNLVTPELEDLSCSSMLGTDSIDCSVQSVSCDAGGAAPNARTVVLVIVDDSGSMDDNDPDGKRQEACASFVEQLGADDIVAITDFGNGGTAPATALQTVQGLTDDKMLARDACASLQSGPVGTPIYGSVVDAASIFLPAAVEQYGKNVNFSVLMLSDGQPDSDTASREQGLQAIADNKFPIYTVGLGPAAEGSDSSDATATQTLQELSQASGGAYASSVAPEGLGGLFEQVGSVVRKGSCEVSASLHADAFASGELVSGQLRFASGDLTTDFSFNVPSSELEASRCK